MTAGLHNILIPSDVDLMMRKFEALTGPGSAMDRIKYPTPSYMRNSMTPSLPPQLAQLASFADQWGKNTNTLQKIGTAPIPVVSDFAGLLGDLQSYSENPEQRTMGNYGLTAMGLLPFMPNAIGSIKKVDSVLPELAYQIEHKPMRISGGASPLHDLEQAFMPDIYSKNALQYYGSGNIRERMVLKLMQSLKGKPDEMVTIYRGVPEGVNKINPGDWVTLHPDVAADYGNVISMKVPAKQITSWPDSLLEFGYYPE